MRITPDHFIAAVGGTFGGVVTAIVIITVVHFYRRVPRVDGRDLQVLQVTA